MRGQMPPAFCQYGAWDFFEIDEKIFGEGGSRSFEK